MTSNLRLSFRQLWKTPGFTAVAVLTLALGIGANTTIFSIIDGIFLKPLPYAKAEEIVSLTSTEPERQLERAGFSWPRLQVMRERQQVFSDTTVSIPNAFTVTGEGDPEQVPGMLAEGNYFTFLGLQPTLGRGFTAEEARPGGPAVVVISAKYWERKFGGAGDVIGRSLILDGRPHTVIGVLPKAFSRFPLNQIDLVAPRPLEAPFLSREQIDSGGFFFTFFGRLKSGVPIEQAREAAKAIAAGYAQTSKASADSKSRIEVDFLLDGLLGNQRRTFQTLFAAVGCLLVIACANVANLLLARFAGRRKEVALRLALGARRRDVIWQCLSDSLVLAFAGGLAGLALSHWSLRLFKTLGADFVPRAQEIGLDLTALLFTTGACLVTGLVVAILPALQTANADVNEDLKDSARGSSGGPRHNLFRNALLVSEVAVSAVLLIAAGLLLSSFLRLQRVDPGFKPAGVFVGFVGPNPSQYPQRSETLANFYVRLYQRLAALPGAKSVALSDNPPLSGTGGGSIYALAGQAVPPPSEQPLAIRHLISPGRFATLGIPFRAGRDFTEADNVLSPHVVIINERMAKRLFGAGDPLGHKLITGALQLTAEIVGVVADTHTVNLTAEPQPEMFFPVFQRPENFTGVLVRTEGDPAALAGSVRAALRQVDASIPLTQPGTMDLFLAQSIVDRRLIMLLLAVFAGLALLLASIGVYSVMAYAVTQRQVEIGVRMALGADSRRVVRMVVADGMKLVAIGVGIGLTGAYAATRLMAALLFGVGAADPAVFGGVVGVIGLVALLANIVPALRATRIDPIVALREG